MKPSQGNTTVTALHKMLDYIENEIKKTFEERIAIEAKQSCLWDIQHHVNLLIARQKEE
jgi:hypothetical protein